MAVQTAAQRLPYGEGHRTGLNPGRTHLATPRGGVCVIDLGVWCEHTSFLWSRLDRVLAGKGAIAELGVQQHMQMSFFGSDMQISLSLSTTLLAPGRGRLGLSTPAGFVVCCVRCRCENGPPAFFEVLFVGQLCLLLEQPAKATAAVQTAAQLQCQAQCSTGARHGLPAF